MADVIIPDVTIYLYADEVKDTADYTEDTTDDAGKYIVDLPIGKYWFKVEGTYNSKPIAEEYRSFTVNEDNIVDWNGQTHTGVNAIQVLTMSCDLGISLLTINVKYEDAIYTNANVEVGVNNERYYPREATDGTGGIYTVDNIKTNATMPIKVTPDPADTNLKEVIQNVTIGNSNKTVDIELFYYFNLQVISYIATNSLTTGIQPPDPQLSSDRVYPGSGALYDSNDNLISTLTNSEGVLLTNTKIKKGTYILRIPSFVGSDMRTYKDYEKSITIEKNDSNTDGLRQITAYIEEQVIVEEPPGNES